MSKRPNALYGRLERMLNDPRGLEKSGEINVDITTIFEIEWLQSLTSVKMLPQFPVQTDGYGVASLRNLILCSNDLQKVNFSFLTLTNWNGYRGTSHDRGCQCQ